jgi:hypothetical protein
LSGIPDVLDVAKALRLKVREEGLQGCEGVLIRPKGLSRGIIAIKKSIRSAGRKRFTIAHEIGHYVLPGHGEHGAICKPTDIENWTRGAKDIERQADDFAAELLIPAAVVASRLVKSLPSLAVIENIADECSASLAASAWRYCDLTGEHCAVVWSAQGKVEWAKRSADFPFFIAKGKFLEQDSYAYNCFKGEKVPSVPQSVPAEAWIESPNLVEGARVYEESRALPSYDSVLTLLWIKDRIQKRTDYDEEREEELDPSDFSVYRKRWPK